MTWLTDDPVALVSIAVAVSGGLFLLVGWVRAGRWRQDSERIELVTSRYLGGKKVLTLVDVEGERLLLALSGNSVRLVARLNRRPVRHRDGEPGEVEHGERSQQRSRAMADAEGVL